MKGTGLAAAWLALLIVGTPAAHGQSRNGLRQIGPGVPAAATPEVESLRRDLQRILAAPGWKGATYSVLAVSLDRGDTLFALDPARRVAPASNMKLFTTAAALRVLGPGYRFATYLLVDAPARGGILEGDAILYGTGDPAISGRMLDNATAPFEAFADALERAGIREIAGDLVGDGSYFDDEWTGAWEEDDLDAYYAAPVGALVFNESMVTIHVAPAAGVGPARVWTRPATIGFALRNEVRTVPSGRTAVRFERGDSGFVLTGTIVRGRGTVSRRLPVVDPANYAAAALAGVLERRGIRVGGVRVVRDAAASRVGFGRQRNGRGGTGSPRVLAIHRSPELREIVRVTNHVSHNLFADALLKAVGRAAAGEGSFDAGGTVLAHLLAAGDDAAAAALRVVDGSGLARSNRVSAGATIALLRQMDEGPLARDFFESLPQAGSADGLRRMYKGPAAGNLRAKTGTIRYVSALSGYVRSADGERIAFSVIANGVPQTWREKQTEDRIGTRLAGFRRPPATSLPRSTAPVQEPPRSDEDLPQLPLEAAPAAKVVVPHAAVAERRVDDAAPAGRQRHMRDPLR